MPAPAKGRRPGGSPAHQKHMLANLATALCEHCKITTTRRGRAGCGRRPGG